MLSEHFLSGSQQTCLITVASVGLVTRLWLCLTVSPVWSTHDHCTRQASGMTCDGDVMEKPSRRWRGAVQQLAEFVEKVSFRATTPAPVIVRATFSWPIYLIFLFSSSGNCLKNVATDFFYSFPTISGDKAKSGYVEKHLFLRFEVFRTVNLRTLKFCGNVL